MKGFIFGAALALSMAALPACSSLKGLDEHSATVKVAITYATMKYIDQAGPGASIARAARVAAFANEALNAIEGDGFQLDAFKAHIVGLLPPTLPIADRVLAVSLIDVIAQEIQNRIGTGVLDAQTRLKVREVLKWIEGATAFYATA